MVRTVRMVRSLADRTFQLCAEPQAERAQSRAEPDPIIDPRAEPQAERSSGGRLRCHQLYSLKLK